MGHGSVFFMKNKVILIYKGEYDEIGGYTATYDEFLVLSRNRCVIYNSGAGYEGENYHIASRSMDLNANSTFINNCFSHIQFSYENKENIVDCDGYGGTNSKLFNIRIIGISEIDNRLLTGELYFENLNQVIRELKFEDYYLIEPFAYSLAGIIPSSIWPNFIKGYVSPIEELAKKQWKKETEVLNSKMSFPAIRFGNYPQSQLKDEKIIKCLDEKYKTPDTNDKWCDYGYKAKDYKGGYMFYIDVELAGTKYRGVYIKEYRPISSGDNIARNCESVVESNGYKKSTVYWFKYEPLIWVICGRGYKSRYLCLNVIDAEPMYEGNAYNNEGASENAFFKNFSSLNKWLNSSFLNTAFSEDDRPSVNAYLLTKKEYLEGLPLKEQRKPRPTDYALIKGYLADLSSRGNDYPFVWTATYIEGFNRMVSISKDGSIIDFHSENHGYITYTYGGVQPALTLNRLKTIPDSNRLSINYSELTDREI